MRLKKIIGNMLPLLDKNVMYLSTTRYSVCSVYGAAQQRDWYLGTAGQTGGSGGNFGCLLKFKSVTVT